MVTFVARWPFSAQAEPSSSDRGGEEGKEGDWRARESTGLGAEGSRFQGALHELMVDDGYVTSSCWALVSASVT